MRSLTLKCDDHLHHFTLKTFSIKIEKHKFYLIINNLYRSVSNTNKNLPINVITFDRSPALQLFDRSPAAVVPLLNATVDGCCLALTPNSLEEYLGLLCPPRTILTSYPSFQCFSHTNVPSHLLYLSYR